MEERQNNVSKVDIFFMQLSIKQLLINLGCLLNLWILHMTVTGRVGPVGCTQTWSEIVSPGRLEC